MESKKKKTLYWIIGIVLVFAFIGIFLPDEESVITSEVIKEEIIDNFSNISEVHWTHMPLKYKFENECIERLVNLSKFAFKKIEFETSYFVSFEETLQEPDISIYCKPSQYDKSGEYGIADAFFTTNPDYENLIIKGEINIYGQGSVCNTGYPALEVHEILHLFDIPHNPLTRSIMHPYSAESSSKCKTTKIDEEYISCLRYIYSNGKFNGSCSFSNYITEDPSDFGDECEEGWFEVEGTGFCCPEPNMVIEEGSCYENGEEPDYICDYNTYNCGDFSSCSEVMEVFNYCDEDIHYLDGDDDGIPCESLCGIWAIEEEEEVPVSEEEYVCSTNVYNCGDFSSCSEVMEVFNGCGFDVHKLDGDNDGIPCESLCGG